MKSFVHSLLAGACLAAGFLLTGCGSPTQDSNWQSQGAPAGGPATDPTVARFRVGDTVTVTYSFSGPVSPLNPHTETIKEDGNITLDLIGSIHALGKTTGELQNEIYTNYVPRSFKHLTGTVSSGDRVIYLGGEVHSPGRVVYVEDTTVTKAIQSAGGLTDFANPHEVWITRATTGQRIRVDYDKALKHPSEDLPVYPDDQINVRRRIL